MEVVLIELVVVIGSVVANIVAAILFHIVHVCCRAHVLFILCSHSIVGPVAVVFEGC